MKSHFPTLFKIETHKKKKKKIESCSPRLIHNRNTSQRITIIHIKQQIDLNLQPFNSSTLPLILLSFGSPKLSNLQVKKQKNKNKTESQSDYSFFNNTIRI